MSYKKNVVYSDSQSAMHMASNPTSGRAKHMDIKYHFTKEAVERGVVSFKYVHTSEQAADGITTEKFRFLPISAGIFFQVQYDVDATSVSILA